MINDLALLPDENCVEDIVTSNKSDYFFAEVQHRTQHGDGWAEDCVLEPKAASLQGDEAGKRTTADDVGGDGCARARKAQKTDRTFTQSYVQTWSGAAGGCGDSGIWLDSRGNILGSTTQPAAAVTVPTTDSDLLSTLTAVMPPSSLSSPEGINSAVLLPSVWVGSLPLSLHPTTAGAVTARGPIARPPSESELGTGSPVAAAVDTPVASSQTINALSQSPVPQSSDTPANAPPLSAALQSYRIEPSSANVAALIQAINVEFALHPNLARVLTEFIAAKHPIAPSASSPPPKPAAQAPAKSIIKLAEVVMSKLAGKQSASREAVSAKLSTLRPQLAGPFISTECTLLDEVKLIL